MTVRITGRSSAPLYFRPLMNIEGVPSTPARSPSSMSRAIVFWFPGTEVRFEPLHVQSDGPGQSEYRGTGQFAPVSEEGIVHGPELPLLMGCDGGSGGQRGLGMHVQRKLLEDELDLPRIRFQNRIQLGYCREQ